MAGVEELLGGFLARRREEEPDTWNNREPADQSATETLWWRGVIPLAQIAFVDQSGQPAGYVLLATDERLPPVFEYSDEGPPLSTFLKNSIEPKMRAAGVNVPPQRLIFVTSTELFAEFDLQERGLGVVLVKVPEAAAVSAETVSFGDSDPESVFEPASVRAMRQNLLRQATSGHAILNLAARPTLYEQGCDRYSALECKVDLEATTSRCSPARIAGCVPVGWAMLMSAWKRSKVSGSQNIWRGSSCWTADWPSVFDNKTNPNICSDVNRSIWRLHKIMNTGADGNTGWSELSRGAEIFKEQGLNWSFGRQDGQSFETCCSILAKGQPFLWRSEGSFRSLAPASGAPAAVGHAVCVFGFNRRTRSLHIGLGWGGGARPKYVLFDQFKNNACFFVTSFAGIAEEPENPAELPAD